jgi:vacuolar-type H+-ATPase subunit I/STV1
MQVFIIGTGNKSIDEAVKKLNSIQGEIRAEEAAKQKLVEQIAQTEDAAKKKRLEVTLVQTEQDIAAMQQSVKKLGIRPATDEERKTALQSIPNMDERRRHAPNYMNEKKCWVKVQ